MKTIIFIFTIIFSTQVFCLDLDQEKINVAYINLPLVPILNIVDRSYSYSFYSPDQRHELQTTIENNFHIEGFKNHLNKAYIHLDFEFQELIINTTDVKVETTETKDSDGNTKIEYKYTPVITYRTSAKIHVNYADGSNKTYRYGQQTNEYNGKETTTRQAANLFLANNIYHLKNEINHDFMQETVASLNVDINELHGYTAVHTTDFLLIMDSKKYPEYHDYKKFKYEIISVFNSMSPQQPLLNSKNSAKINRAIEFLKKIPAKYPKRKKAHKKIRYASFYNLAIINHYLENFDEAIEYYQKVIFNDYHEGKSKRNIQAIYALQKLYSLNQVNTRHFDLQKLHNNSSRLKQ